MGEQYAKVMHSNPATFLTLKEKPMKLDKQTFEAIIADLELTLSDEKKMFSYNHKTEDYDLGWEVGFKAAINQIKRRKKLFIGD